MIRGRNNPEAGYSLAKAGKQPLGAGSRDQSVITGSNQVGGDGDAGGIVRAGSHFVNEI